VFVVSVVLLWDECWRFCCGVVRLGFVGRVGGSRGLWAVVRACDSCCSLVESDLSFSAFVVVLLLLAFAVGMSRGFYDAYVVCLMSIRCRFENSKMIIVRCSVILIAVFMSVYSVLQYAESYSLRCSSLEEDQLVLDLVILV